ncbi:MULTISPECIES: sulfatase [Halomicrobium]|uniref:Sulfatase n=2 Tax=Halomicrobium mukohataei TaxID=57705 RepID=C7NZ83_HALMD|nr:MULTISPECIES: sulfatase [Halomicrobium]ACV46769.1 sulfatase [Halomicrobium mukohataei DSM 12286]QCD65276.1 sulfatase [Halomicrobium mukohataei]QFR20082.1 sulfatase-like hydrolase/transferase [Halomicrobium sp. ZPS1]
MGSPNVLLVVLDATRKDHLSCYGYDRPTTPELDAVAQAGTRYEQAIAPAPWTPPSHASMFTGRYPSGHGSFGTQPLGEYDGATVAELLSAAGYATFGFSNSHHTSIEQEFDRGFDYYHDILALPRFMDTMYEPSLDFLRFLPRYFRDGYDISDFQRRKLETQVRRADGPFFGFINFNATHAPYRPPEEFRAPFEERFDDWDAVDETAARKVGDDEGYEYILGDVTMSPTEWELVECWYDAEIRYVDALLGELFDCLRRQGVYDDTLVVVTADHGEHFGEHGLAYHQFSLFEELLNVPLLVKWPEGDRPSPAPGTVSDRLVSLVDLVPTICEWAGVAVPDEVDGRALTGDDDRDAVFAEYDRPYPPLRERLQQYDSFEAYDRGLQAVRTETHKLIRPTVGEATLYRLTGDGEVEVSDDEREAALAQRLDETLEPLPDTSRTTELDDHVSDHLEKMGYL